MRQLLLTVMVFFYFSLGLAAQDAADGRAIALTPERATSFLNGIASKFSSLNDRLSKKTEQYLTKLEKQETKLYNKLYRKDSAAAKKLFAANSARYQQMRDKLHGADSAPKKLKEYLPGYDTLSTTLNYLEKSMPNSPGLQAARASAQQFGSRMQVSNEIKKQLRERKQLLNKQLEQYGMAKELKSLNKETYYYQQQLNEYKALLKDRDRAERKALSLLRESSLFREFMKRNSMLSQLFKVPDNYGSPESLAGLQTVAGVQQLLNQQAGSGGINGMQAFRQGIGQARAQLGSLRSRVNSLGGGGSNMDMPTGFKPNTQRTKTFLQRLEYGMNFQTQKQRGILPVTTDIGLSAGYKLNDKSVVGIGASYKLGWGSGIKDIRLSSQGLGLRSYVDIKLPSFKGGARGGFWITGGYEMDYRHAFTKYTQLYNVNAWQRSGLLGISKKYRIGKKEQQAQLLWDFLSYGQRPRTEAFKFRIGYKL